MKKYELKDFTGGWFIGDFDPAIIHTKDYEVALKEYKAGDKESKHMHKIATEITLIASGRVRMNGVEYEQGDIIVMEPGDATDFEAIEDVKNVVLKFPSVIGDKYEVTE